MGVGASLCATLLVGGCAADEPDAVLSSTDQASTVGDYQATGCSTAVVIGLSKQIADEAGCENPASFVSFAGAPGITLSSSAVLPYLVKGARDDLEKVAASNSLQINSALRSIAQQYLLYRWYQQGRCGITAAATVGHSNHEGGRAVDLNNYSSRISAMSARGWAHAVAGDRLRDRPELHDASVLGRRRIDQRSGSGAAADGHPLHRDDQEHGRGDVAGHDRAPDHRRRHEPAPRCELDLGDGRHGAE